MEFLWGYMERSEIMLPRFVDQHDSELSQGNPLQDYGLYNTSTSALGSQLGGGGLAEPAISFALGADDEDEDEAPSKPDPATAASAGAVG